MQLLRQYNLDSLQLLEQLKSLFSQLFRNHMGTIPIIITWPGCAAHPAGGAPLDGRTSAETRRKDHAQQARRVSQRARPSTRPMTGVSLVLHPLPTSARSFRSSSKTPKSGNAASLSASPQLKSRSPTATTIILRAVASSSEDGG